MVSDTHPIPAGDLCCRSFCLIPSLLTIISSLISFFNKTPNTSSSLKCTVLHNFLPGDIVVVVECLFYKALSSMLNCEFVNYSGRGRSQRPMKERIICCCNSLQLLIEVDKGHRLPNEPLITVLKVKTSKPPFQSLFKTHLSQSLHTYFLYKHHYETVYTL